MRLSNPAEQGQASMESFTLASAHLGDEPEVVADEDKAAVPVIDRPRQRVDGLDVLHAQEHRALRGGCCAQEAS